MNRSAKRYFDLAYEYQISALTLYTQIFSASYLYNPTAFLFRHSIELLLKGLIITEVKRSSRIRVDAIMVGKRKLNETHSLGELWNKYNSVKQRPWDPNMQAFIDKTIKKFNSRDPFSERFRYPRSKLTKKKDSHNYPLEPVQINHVDKAPDLADGIPFLILDNGEAAIIERGPYLLQELNDIVETTEFLFDLAEE